MDDIELFYNQKHDSYVIREGDGFLELTSKQFKEMREDGRSPLLRKLWRQAKKERAEN